MFLFITSRYFSFQVNIATKMATIPTMAAIITPHLCQSPVPGRLS